MAPGDWIVAFLELDFAGRFRAVFFTRFRMESILGVRFKSTLDRSAVDIRYISGFATWPQPHNFF